MYRYRCPRCERRLELRSLFDRRYLLSCTSCRLAHILESFGGGDDAYLKFLEDFDRCSIIEGADFEALLEKEGILRSEKRVRMMVSRAGLEFNDLPAPLKKAVLSRQDYLVQYRLLEPQRPEYDGNPRILELDSDLVDILEENGIMRFYKFQTEAMKRVFSGENVIIVAPTGSGKTEAFAIPVIQQVARLRRLPDELGFNRIVKALFIYPTKALGRDQLPKLEKISGSVNVRIRVFDGDTPQAERRKILDNPPEIIITNFDVLHHHLMHRTRFSQLLTGIKYVVVDEVHAYTGTFGANVHFILRRLQRLTDEFQIVAASATIANPQEFCGTLFNRNMTVVSESKGKHGRIHFTILFPTLRSHRSLMIDLLKDLTASNYRPIVFSSSHLGAELTAFYGRKNAIDVEVHRAGLLPDHRKKVEEMFRIGHLQAISATPTLELGIDVGTVDAIVSDLVPISRLIQRTGRAARRGQEGLAFLALRENDPISQYYKNNPDHYFEDVEPAYVDPTNAIITEVQLLAAAMDKPLRRGEFCNYDKELNSLVVKELLVEHKGRLLPIYSKVGRILSQHDIRGGGGTVSIRLEKKKIGERSLPQALDELHQGAIYFLGGTRFRSSNLILQRDNGVAEVERIPLSYPYYTKSLVEEHPSILNELERRKVMGVEVMRCELAIEKRVLGYVNLELGAIIGQGQKIFFDKPLEYRLNTKGFVFKAPTPQETAKSFDDVMVTLVTSSFHAVEHVTIEGSNMITGGVGADMGGISLGSSGLIFIYDGSPGGNGATKILFDRLGETFKRGFKILNECTCTSESGCPRCTYSYRCGNNNEYLHRDGAKEVLKSIISGQETSIPQEISPLERSLV